MRVLMLHNRYLQRGGEDESTDTEVALLRSHGHEVDFLEMDNRQILAQSPLRTALGTVWSHSAYRLVHRQLRERHYDLVHVQNFFPLFSPAVYYASRAQNVPIVQALRNYRLFCLNGLFHRDGKACEACMGKFLPYPGVAYACYRQSRAASLTVAAMLSMHRILRTWQRKVNVFYTLTEFARRKFIEGGIPAQKIMVKPNFVSDPGQSETLERNYALLVSRLVPEKGVLTVLEAWSNLPISIPLKIVGSGPLEARVRERAVQNPSIEYVGQMKIGNVFEVMKMAFVVLFPSELYETFGRTIIESFACGKPVIVSNFGTMTELVDERQTGLRFKVGNANDLAAKVEWAWTHPIEMAQMGRNARREYELKYTPERNYEMLMDIYRQAIENHQRRSQDRRA